MNCVKQTRKFLAAVFLSVFVLGSLFAQQQATRRIGLFVGANDGSSEEDKLSFAQSDAKAVSQIFSELGEINEKDNNFLPQPTLARLNSWLEVIKNELADAKKNGQETELIFYYAGHFDGEDLNLGPENYPIKKLSEQIESIEADARIVIFDMCYAGVAARALRPLILPPSHPSLFIGSSVLTSTKEDEKAYEWGSIKSTYFTHSLITGLRGAADDDGDSTVSFKELSDFVKKEVRIKTINSKYPQDPQSKGSEKPVLTNIRRPSRARFTISGDVTGRIRILDNSRNFIVSELTKEHQRPMELTLDSGDYQLILFRENSFGWAKRQLRRNQNIPLRMRDFVTAGTMDELRNKTPVRGSEAPEFFFSESPLEYSSSSNTAASQRPVSIDKALEDAVNGISGHISSTNNTVTIRILSELSKHPALSKIIEDKLTTIMKNKKSFEIVILSGEVVEVINELVALRDTGYFRDDSQIPPGQNPTPNILITVDVTPNSGNTYYLHVKAFDRGGVLLYINDAPLFYAPLNLPSSQEFYVDLGGGYSLLSEAGGTYESIKINLAAHKIFTQKIGVGFYGTVSVPLIIKGQGTTVSLYKPEYDAFGLDFLIGPTFMLYKNKSETFCLPLSAGISYSYLKIDQRLQKTEINKNILGLGINGSGEYHFHPHVYGYARVQLDFGFYTLGNIKEKKISGSGLLFNFAPALGVGFNL